MPALTNATMAARDEAISLGCDVTRFGGSYYVLWRGRLDATPHPSREAAWAAAAQIARHNAAARARLATVKHNNVRR